MEASLVSSLEDYTPTVSAYKVYVSLCKSRGGTCKYTWWCVLFRRELTTTLVHAVTTRHVHNIDIHVHSLEEGIGKADFCPGIELATTDWNASVLDSAMTLRQKPASPFPRK